MQKLRLVKTVLQHTFVIFDDGEITEAVTEPVTVPASEWPTYAQGRFLVQQSEMAEALGAEVWRPPEAGVER